MPTQKTQAKYLQAVDFFCGAGGMSYGLHLAGIRMLGGVDLDPDCKKTYEANIPGAKFLNKDITTLSEADVGEFFDIAPDDDSLIFCGCSPCQFWSKVRTDRGRSRKTAFLLRQFERFISHFRPGFVVVENVPGLRNKKDHTILPQFLAFLTKNGYAYRDTIVDAINYGVPQHRHRYLLLATRLAKKIRLPRRQKDSSLTVKRFIGGELTPLAAGEEDATDSLHKAARLSKKNLRRVQVTPIDGGDRSSWREGAGAGKWIYSFCVMPLCDALRLQHSKQFREGRPVQFPFWRMKEDVFSESQVARRGVSVGLGDGSQIALSAGGKARDTLWLHGFSVSGATGTVVAQANAERQFVLPAEGNLTVEWVGQLKPLHAQRIAHDIGQGLSRVGLAEAEWLRLLCDR
jgi:DNA-cytosine methyltransferase